MVRDVDKFIEEVQLYTLDIIDTVDALRKENKELVNRIKQLEDKLKEGGDGSCGQHCSWLDCRGYMYVPYSQ